MPEPAVLVLEYVVAELDQAVELLVDLIGLEEVDRYPHPTLDADVVMLKAGTVAINLVHPTDVGDRPPFRTPEPRLAHITLGVSDDAALQSMADRLVEGGVAVVATPGAAFHLAPQVVEAVFGAAPPLVFVRSEG